MSWSPRKKLTFVPLYETLFGLGLSLSEVAVYGAIDAVAGDGGICYASAATLAKRAGVCDRQARRALLKLAKAGLIRVDGRAGATPVITFTDVLTPDRMSGVDPGPDVLPPRTGCPHTPDMVSGTPDQMSDDNPLKTPSDNPSSNSSTPAAADLTLDLILKEIQFTMPTTRRGEKWERELVGVDEDLIPEVAACLRTQPSANATTPIVLVREAVADARMRRGGPQRAQHGDAWDGSLRPVGRYS